MQLPLDTGLGLPYSALIPLNAEKRNSKMSYFTIINTRDNDNDIKNKRGFLICNEQMEHIDTFVLPNAEIDHHEYQENDIGERLFFVKKDTIIDISNLTGQKKDTAFRCLNELIKIVDASGRETFSWDPLKNLGFESEFSGYKQMSSRWYKGAAFDWAHANSLYWDEDGNILYSFRFIGIGKISKLDGHIIWRIDRKCQRPNPLSDSIPIFLQHDFKVVRTENGEKAYSFWSSGDKTANYCIAYQFTVTGSSTVPVFKLLKHIKPQFPVTATDAGGNYDTEPDGSYLLNYGKYQNDTTAYRSFFEYRNQKNTLIGQYAAPNIIVSYRIHRLFGMRPARPVIIQKEGSLTIADVERECTWYKISNASKKEIVMVGKSKTYYPREAGAYCATISYGIGYSVSKPINFIKTK
jgi:hypothetical protein